MQTIYALLALLLAMLLGQELMQAQMHMLRQNIRREQTEIATAVAMRLHELISTRQTGTPGICQSMRFLELRFALVPPFTPRTQAQLSRFHYGNTFLIQIPQ